MILKNLKKPTIIIFVVALGLVLFSQTTMGKRVLIESSVIQAIRTFFAGNPELHACDYKDGEILFIKPIATGVGNGRYEAGDIVSIKSGEERCRKFGDQPFLSETERTSFLPVYYPAKLTKEQKKELLEPELEKSPENSALSPEGIATSQPVELKAADVQPPKMTKRRLVGVDYTKFLSDSDILKIRNFEKLDRLPEIDLTVVVKKPAGQASAINLPRHLARAEEIKETIKKIAKKIIPPARAATEVVHIVDPGMGAGYDYDSLFDWDAGEQGDLTGVRDEIAVAKCRSTGGTADTVNLSIYAWTTSATQYIKIWTDPAEGYRHNGTYETGNHYRIETANGSPIFSQGNASHIRIDGLEISVNSTNSVDAGFYIANAGAGSAFYLSNCIIRDTGSTNTTYGVRVYDSDAVFYAWNNIFYDFDDTVFGGTGINFRYGSTAYIYNNTFSNCYTGIVRQEGTVYAKNNLFNVNSTTDYGLVQANCDYNATNLSSFVYGANTNDHVSHTFSFAGASDFHLQFGDIGAKDLGLTNPGTGLFSDDIDAQTRSAPWDIGADEYVGGAPPVGETTNSTAPIIFKPNVIFKPGVIFK